MKIDKSILMILALIIISFLVVGAGCKQEETTTTGKIVEEPEIKEATIIIENFQFNPKELTINKGTKLYGKTKGPICTG